MTPQVSSPDEVCFDGDLGLEAEETGRVIDHNGGCTRHGFRFLGRVRRIVPHAQNRRI
ncbi:hypothetical protein AAFF_G00264130 [Aldrovandia affinis]|uniref:Uncharacterized protein n=1 Tax=Aldrovandia affinis TaxID=143900 RepID=A0AAD7SSX4_9TELE|nr:hypothetical protein AAFF_G00264130 [Aldrovandia affinis]